MTSPPRAELVVDLAAIRANVGRLLAECGPVMAVVKADGYGHGMIESAKAAQAGGATWLGVATIDEALALRCAGIEGPVLCWLAAPGEDYAAAIGAGVDVTAYTVAEIAEIVAAVTVVSGQAPAQVLARVQLKVDTGLSRGGATLQSWREVVAAAARAEREGQITVTGIWSHLACADEPEHPANQTQEQRFRDALAIADEEGLRPQVRHLANSAAALTRPSSRFDLVRCGIAIYGLSPAPTLGTAAEFGLLPAMTATARLTVVKRVCAGEGVSYGHTYVTPAETTLAVIPVGYGEGIPRSASSVAPVLVGGKVRTVAGRVCMDQFVVDVGDDEVAVGDEAILFGSGAHGEPTVQDWAQAIGTINYEVVTAVGGRFARRYVS